MLRVNNNKTVLQVLSISRSPGNVRVKIAHKTLQRIGEHDVHISYPNGEKLLRTYTAAKPSNWQIYIAIDYP